MNKRIVLFINILIIIVMIPSITFSCELTYEEYAKLGIRSSYVVGDYVFNRDEGFSPSIEDISIASRSIKTGKSEYVDDLFVGSTTRFRYSELLSNTSTTDVSGFPNIDVLHVYLNHIKTASEAEHYDLTCPANMELTFKGLTSVGDGTFVTSANRLVSVSSSNGISKASYCITSDSSCTPNTDTQVDENNTFNVSYPGLSSKGEIICVEGYDKDSNASGVTCDTTRVYVDSHAPSVSDLNVSKITEGTEEVSLSDLFDVSYSVSGGKAKYFYYDGDTKLILNDVSSLSGGEIKDEVKVTGGNNLVTIKQGTISVGLNSIKYMADGKEIETRNVVNGANADLSVEATKEGYTFMGWNTSSSAHEGLSSYQVTSDTTLYAIFKKELKGTFKVYSVSEEVPAVESSGIETCSIYNEETSCEIGSPTLSANPKYEVIGYSDTENSTVANVSNIISLSEDKTFYSVTKKIIAPTGTFITGYKDGKYISTLISCNLYNGATSCSLDATEVNKLLTDNSLQGFTKSVEEVSSSGLELTATNGRFFYGYYETDYKLTYVSGINTSTTEEIDTFKTYKVITDTGIKDVGDGTHTIKTPAVIDGYTGLGFREDQDTKEATYKSGESISITGDKKLYGVYSKEITLSYSGVSGASLPSNQVGTIIMNSGNKVLGTTSFKLDDGSNFSMTNQILTNWINKTTGTVYNIGETINLSVDTIVEARTALDGCVVTFDYGTNGGESANVSSSVYTSDMTSMDLSGYVAKKQGYTFMGWSKKSNSTDNIITTLTITDPANNPGVTLYAIYKKAITITLKVMDTKDVTFSDGTLTYNISGSVYNNETKINVNLPTTKVASGYTFVGYTDVSGSETKEYEEGKSYDFENNTTLYTISYNNTALVSTYYYYNGTSVIGANVECNRYNGSASCVTEYALPSTEYEGSSAIGYSTSASTYSLSSKQEITSNTSFYTIYRKTVMAVEYSYKDSTKVDTVSGLMTYITGSTSITKINANITLGIPYGIEGYTTTGWVDGSGNTYGSNTSVSISETTSYYGNYTKQISLKYNSMGGDTTPTTQSQVVKYASNTSSSKVQATFTTSPGVSKSGYEFVSWMVGSESSTTEVGGNTSYTVGETTILYAKYKLSTYTVTYDGTTNGGSGTTTKTVSYLGNVDLSVSASKEGYIFVGWNTDPNGTTGLKTKTLDSASNLTLYAIYSKVITATFKMVDTNAGSITNSEVTCKKYNNNETCSVMPSSINGVSGYTILGYSDVSGSETVKASLGTYVEISADTTFYSVTRKTTPLVVTFYYAVNDTISNTTTNCYLYNGNSTCTLSVPGDSTSSTYNAATFIDYSTSSVSNVAASNYSISSDTVYYAYYELIVTITYNDGTYTTSGSSNTSIYTSKVTYLLTNTSNNKYVPSVNLKEETAVSGWTSLGYRSDTSETTQTYTSGQSASLTTSLMLYGVYSRGITLTFDEAGGSTVSDITKTQYMNSVGGKNVYSVTLPTTTRTNYAFQGWRIGTITYPAGGTYILETDVVAMADWKIVCPYSVGQTWSYDYTGGSQAFTTPCTGTYKFETWGAQGGNSSSTGGTGGKGAYTSGVLSSNINSIYYLFVGGQGSSATTSAGGYNGGGYNNGFSQAAGGGATDVRLVNGSYNDATSLNSRIMVSAGGSGSDGYNGNPGGGLNGFVTTGSASTQISSGSGSTSGSFGIGAIGSNTTGAGGGYWGGSSAVITRNSWVQCAVEGGTCSFAGRKYIRYGMDSGNTYGFFNSSVGCNNTVFGDPNGGVVKACWYASDEIYVAGSGSSYISGYLGSIAISSSNNRSPRQNASGVTCTTANASGDVTCSYHYSGNIFASTSMNAGNASMPTHDGTSTMTGNAGNGYAKITLVTIAS